MQRWVPKGFSPSVRKGEKQIACGAKSDTLNQTPRRQTKCERAVNFDLPAAQLNLAKSTTGVCNLGLSITSTSAWCQKCLRAKEQRVYFITVVLQLPVQESL
jgi:hypothetical protein